MCMSRRKNRDPQGQTVLWSAHGGHGWTSMADRGEGTPPAPAPTVRVQILSFWHTHFSKCNCLGSQRPLRVRRPLREILDPTLEEGSMLDYPDIQILGSTSRWHFFFCACLNHPFIFGWQKRSHDGVTRKYSETVLNTWPCLYHLLSLSLSVSPFAKL